jgi:glycosyltransferase involved in cell wall biosynthesis
MKGVVETLTKNQHYIDIVCDGEPESNFLTEYKVNVYYPSKEERLAYSKHSNLFQFSDSFNFEKSINFRTAIIKALSNHVYDVVICNDTESAFVCNQMELHKSMKVASYAHECATVNPTLGEGVFKNCYYDLIDKMMFWPDITTLIQTEQNKTKLLDKFEDYPIDLNTVVQLYPLTDSNSQNIKDIDGLLYIGRHEDRKNPGEYIKVLKAIKDKYGVEVKANVMTRSAHVKKFEADFAAIGHTNYEIVSDVVGDEKAKIIQKSKVAFMPYKNESFGIAVLEALRYMPTVVLDKYDWHYNFKGFSNYIVADSKEVVDIIWSAYNTWTVDKDKVDAEFAEYQNKYESSLLNLLEGTPCITAKQEPRNRLYTYLQAHKGYWVSLTDYFKEENSKGVIYLTSDIETIYTSLGWIKVLHTHEHTFVGIPDNDEFKGFLIVKNDSHSESLSCFFE